MKRFLWISAVVLLLSVAITLAVAYQATQQVPEFYLQAIKSNPQQQQQASTEMFNRGSRLLQKTKKHGRWQAEFTADQINGYLAIDLEKQFPDVLPAEVKDPRVAITPGRATIACRYESDRISSVLSLGISIYLSEPNVVALRVHKARAGRLPLPLSEVLDVITTTAQHMELPLEWRQIDGDPVALITIPRPRDEANRPVILESLELREGLFYVAGKTLRRTTRRSPQPNAMTGNILKFSTMLDARSAEALSQPPQRIFLNGIAKMAD